jgi:O-antigen/teichoic acid export membrane protein
MRNAATNAMKPLTFVSRWLKDHHFRSLLKNSSYLAAAQVVSATTGIMTVAFTGRALGVQMFGMLVLISSYAALISGISKFQSWQLVVRYGGKALATDQPQEFKAAVGFALGLDVFSGVVGMVVGIALLPLIATKVGIPSSHIGAAILYCTLIPTMASATPEGTLRTLDRFDLIAWQGSGYSIGRAILAGIAWAVHAPFEIFVLIWYITNLGGDIWLWILTWRELRARGLLRGIRPTLRPKTLVGAWRFAIYTNLFTTLLSGSRSITPLIVGGMLGPAAAGLYRVASNASNAVRKPADLLLKAYYPQIAGMDFATKAPWRLMVRAVSVASCIALAAALVVLVGGKPIIAAIFGKHFLGAYGPLLVLCVGSLLGMLSAPLAPTLYTLDRPEVPLRARLLGTGAHLLFIAPLTWKFGLVGTAMAFVIGYTVSLIYMMVTLTGIYRRLRRPAANQ